MQDHVLQWLGGNHIPPGQQPLTLGHAIDSFEADFANGYLFGQILSQYGICESLATFSKKTNKEAKVHNFYQIEDALRRLKLPFDAKLIHNVMSEEPGAAIRLLYTLKRGLDSHFSNSDQSVTGLKQRVVDQHVKHVRDLEVKLPAIHREYGISGPSIRSKKLQLVEQKLLKFELAKANLYKKAISDEKAERTMLMSMQQSKRQEALGKMQENQQFMREWNETGRQNWKKNQDRRAFEISRSNYFDDREVKIFRDTLDKELNHHNIDMQEGIAQFHENLRKLGVEENITIQEAIERQEKKKGIPPGQIQNFSYAATMNKIKETKNVNEFAGKERERRQRKLKVDQIKIQEMLDSEKKEELLLQKLLAKQTAEQKQAYANWRAEKCKEIVTANKVQKATEFREDRLQKTAQIEKQMRDEAIAGEDDRQLQHFENKQSIKLMRRDEKMKKRRVNIEIASEIIDLIMDVADEAFAFQETHKDEEDEYDRQLKKETWRDWMGIFTQGKKVSEANIVIKQDEIVEKSDGDKNALGKLLGLGSENMTTEQVIDRVKHDQIYSDFLQYISISGHINMQLFANDKWLNLLQVVQTDPLLRERRIDLSFLDSPTIPANQELGLLIQDLFSTQDLTRSETKNQINNTASLLAGGASTFTIHKTHSQLAMSKMEIIAEDEHTERSSHAQPPLPLWHTFKLCLIGKAYSGKKSAAAQIKEELGDQVTLFNMDDIVREALNYVSTDKKEEVPDPKAKAKKGNEPAHVDVFAGLDTTTYKLIATDLLKHVFVQTGQEKVPGKDVNIVSLIKNDQQLVNLFIEKLRLTFNQPPPSAEEREAKMRQNLAKEEDLRAQLAEALEAEANAAEQTAAAGKGAKAPKGGKNQAKGSKEIQEEIDHLMSVEKTGWILLDFPRTVNQAKLLENTLTGFRSPSDTPKPFAVANQEIWTNFADPFDISSDPVKFMAQPSFFDSIFLLDTSRDECVRRGLLRKIDPTTNVVYHMEDSPPPSGDQKLLDRLQDCYGQQTSEHDLIAFLDQSHLESCDNEQQLQRFYLEFGTFDRESGLGIESFKPIRIESKQTKDEVFAQIGQQLHAVTRFKQLLKDREYQALRDKIQAEQEAEGHEEEQPAEDQQKEDEGVTPKNVDEKNATQGKLSELRSDQQSKRSYSRSISQVGGVKRGGKKKEFTRDYKLSVWEEMTLNYFREGMTTISQIKKQAEAVTDFLNMSQSDFVQFLERPDQKQQLVSEFISSYNQFTQEYPDLRQDDQTKEELMFRVEQLSAALWAKIEQKKAASLLEIQKQAEEGWSAMEMKNVCKSMAKLIEIEIRKFNTVYQIAVEQDPPIELDAEIMVKKMLERGSQPYDAQTGVSPIFNNVVAKLVQNLDDLTVQTYKEFNFGNNPNALVLEQEKSIFLYRLAMIQAWALCLLEEISVNSSEVYSLMDDWVVEAVSIENNSVQAILDSISEFIQSNSLMMNEEDFVVQPTQLYGSIEMKAFGVNQDPLYLQRFEYPEFKVEQTRFDVRELNQLFGQFKRSVGERGSFDLLDEQSFVNLMMLAFRQGRIPFIWRFMSIDRVQKIAKRFRQQALPVMALGDEPSEFQSKLNSTASKSFQNDQSRHWVNWKLIMLHFVLLNSPIPTAEQLESFQASLLEASEGSNQITCEQFKKVPAWFDAAEGRADSSLTAQWLQEAYRQSLESVYEDEDISEDQVYARLDLDRLSAIKELVFNILRVKVGSDALKIGEVCELLNEVSGRQRGKSFSSALLD